MDPNACVDRICVLCSDNHNLSGEEAGEEVRDLLHDLEQWLTKGGFPPDPEHVAKLAVAMGLVVDGFWL